MRIVLSTDYVVSENSQFIDDRPWEVLITLEQHSLLPNEAFVTFFVFTNVLLNLIVVCFVVFPSRL